MNYANSELKNLLKMILDPEIKDEDCKMLIESFFEKYSVLVTINHSARSDAPITDLVEKREKEARLRLSKGIAES